MAEPARKTITVAEFLDWDDGTGTRHQLIGGEIVAMTPPLMDHGDLVAAITIAIGTRLRRPCRPINDAGIAPPARDDTYYVADIAVTCESGGADKRYLEAPKVIIEVLSPATTAEDLGVKLPDYRAIPSVREIAFFSRAKRVDIWRREAAGWHVDDLTGGDRVVFPSIGVEFDLDEVYRGLEG